MKDKFRIRKANQNDTEQIRDIIRNSVAEDKRLPCHYTIDNHFLEEFADKLILKGEMVVVENKDEVMELIGQVHEYTYPSGGNEGIKELLFFPGHTSESKETELVDWLFVEIKNKHQDVFRVELNTPVKGSESVEHFRQMGLRVEGKYSGRLATGGSCSRTIIPLSWIN